MDSMPHGGDIDTFRTQFSCTPLDFSANTNPLGISPLAKQALRAALDGADAYPDPYCRALRVALAAAEDVDKECIVCGNGAADLIYRLVLASRPRKALVLAPSFGEYEDALRSVGCVITRHVLYEEDNFALTEEVLDAIDETIDMLFLCEPNNPTGLMSSVSLLEAIVRRCEQTHTLLVVDECFNGFLRDPEAQSMKRFVPAMPQVVILRAFTKLYGMAGVRLGYLFSSNQALRSKLAAVSQHWPVSSLAQEAGKAALQDEIYVAKTRALIASQREVMQRGLEALGLRVFPGEANYLLVRSEMKDVWQRLAQQGILVRDCSTYQGLTSGFVRVAVRLPEDNARLLKAFSNVVHPSVAQGSVDVASHVTT